MPAVIEHSELDQTELPEFPVKRWTLEEYSQLVNFGIFDDMRVELVEGWICSSPVDTPLHDGMIAHIDSVLRKVVTDQHRLRSRMGLKTLHSELSPDFAIVSDFESFSSHACGTDSLLVVEVSDDSLAKDRRKASVYSAAGIPEYWIINLQQNSVEVFQRLNPKTRQYLIQQILTAEQTISLTLGEKTHTISVANLLPPADLETAS